MTALSLYKHTILPSRNVIATWKLQISGNSPTTSQIKSVNEKAASTGITLPPLPVPYLNKTIEKFLNFAKPLQLPHEYEKTINIASRFLENEESKLLQTLLEQRAQNLPNWLTPWWIYVAYLNTRTPLPVVTSPGVTFPCFKFVGIDGQVEYAAKIIQAALKFHHKIIRNELEDDKGPAGISFDMSQYKFIFGTTRIPQTNCDQIRYGCDQPIFAPHILVTRNGHTFYMNPYNDEGQILGLAQIQNQLLEIVANTENPQIEAINIVSSDDRETWAAVYERIKRNNPNEAKTYEDALFVMCLDKDFGGSGHAEEQNMKMALHGGGSKLNSRNRWFDKTLQFYVNENGYGGMTYEHTPAEGPPLARILDFICEQIYHNSFELTSNCGHKKPRKLNFKLDSEDKEAIYLSEKKLEKVVQNLEVKLLAFDQFGKDVPKQARLSPDSWIQLALQLAFHRMHGSHAPAYETGTLRKFEAGRTDTIRLPTMESVQFVEAMSEVPRQLTDHDLFALLEAAVLRHKKYSMEVMNGMGIDRHLLGLRLIANENQHPVPELLQSDAYKKMMHFLLSTSQVPTKHFLQMGFGPSELDCYGVCYNPQESRTLFTITAFNECTATSAERFSMELRKALLDMRDVVDRAGKLKDRAKL